MMSSNDSSIHKQRLCIIILACAAEWEAMCQTKDETIVETAIRDVCGDDEGMVIAASMMLLNLIKEAKEEQNRLNQ